MADEKKEAEETEEAAEEAPKKASPVKAILVNLGVALLLGGAAAGVVFIAPFKTGQCNATASESGGEKQTKSYQDAVFVNLEPLVITLGPNAKSEYLKISISVETTHEYEKDAERLQPRFRDVLNTYLRAVDERDLIEPFAMTRLRAQMLRRMQTVASADIVEDVLITDFVLN